MEVQSRVYIEEQIANIANVMLHSHRVYFGFNSVFEFVLFNSLLWQEQLLHIG